VVDDGAAAAADEKRPVALDLAYPEDRRAETAERESARYEERFRPIARGPGRHGRSGDQANYGQISYSIQSASLLFILTPADLETFIAGRLAVL
jgi:hypothetical protein